MEGTAHFITEGEGKVCARASARPPDQMRKRRSLDDRGRRGRREGPPRPLLRSAVLSVGGGGPRLSSAAKKTINCCGGES